MISIFPLWTFHLHVETFQKNLYIEYIALGRSDIPDLVVTIIISLMRVANKEATDPRVPNG